MVSESELVENLEWGLELARKKSVLEKGKAMGKESGLAQERNRQYDYHLG